MALTICTDCGHEVSDRAETCPGCGGPMHVDAAPSYRPTQTIQQTAKKWKAMRMWGGALVLLSFIPMATATTVGLWVGFAGMAGGFGLVGYSRFGTWWHHE